ncbi:TonB-dependent receptor [Halosquirtibacter xylanolyticus]|uniref:TonB-dependent receptor n=1 Tax=Halosquirtibacter xylanolyticus TaxID=3374599 RepID=UPI003748E9B3|nr:TonB-dependent receptor [Prolixibacteraceae bacterium]
MKQTTFLTLITTLLCVTTYAQKLGKDTISIHEVAIHANQIHPRENALQLDVPLKYIPTATSTISGKTLEELDIHSINEAFDYTTGVKTRMNYGGFQTFRLRGFDKPVVMQDGQIDYRMVYSSSAPMTSLSNVSKVEFIKGPASALYGGSSVGGIINIVRKSPWDKEEGRISFNTGSYNTNDFQLNYCKQISPKLAIRLDGNILRSDGWRDNGVNKNNLYFALGWKASDKDELQLRLGAFDDQYDTEAGTPAFKNDIFSSKNDTKIYNKGELPSNMSPDQRYNDPTDFLKSKNQNIYLSWKHQFTHNNYLDLTASFNNDDIDYFSTEELTYITSDTEEKDHYYMKGDQKQYIDINQIKRSYPLRFQHKTKTIQSTLAFHSTFNLLGMKHHTASGINYFQTFRDSYTGYGKDDVWGPGEHAVISVENPILNQGEIHHKLSAVNTYDDVIVGINVQDLIDVTKHFKIMIGGRLDNFFFNKEVAKVDEHKNKSNIDNKGSYTDHAFSYKLGMVYEVANNVSLFGSVSNFYKPYRETYNANYIYKDTNGNKITPSGDDKIFDPETGIQYELGIKVERNNLSAQATAYKITKNNIKSYLGKEDNKKVYGQIGEINSTGLELDITYYVTKALDINGGYGYNKTLDSKDQQGAFSPQNTAYGRVRYKLSQGMFKGLSAWWGMVYTDTQFSDSGNTYLLPSSTVQNIGLRLDKKHYWIQANVKNLTDQLYYNSAVYSNQYIASPGRNWSVTLGLKL